MSNTFNLKESYLSNLGDNNNTTINAVDNNLDVKNKTIPKESKQDFEDFKTQYKGVIDMKCSQDYGNSEDKDLWEDCAKELFLKSKNYILLGDEYEPKSLEKKTENKQLTESNDINVGDEYINDYGAKITILEPTKDGEYQFKVTNTKTGVEGDVLATRSMKHVLDMNGYKKIDKSTKLESNSETYKSGDEVDIMDSFGKWLNSSDRIKYVIDRPTTKEEIEGIWDIDTPCYIVKTLGMTDDTKFLNGTSKEPITRLRHTIYKSKEHKINENDGRNYVLILELNKDVNNRELVYVTDTDNKADVNELRGNKIDGYKILGAYFEEEYDGDAKQYVNEFKNDNDFKFVYKPLSYIKSNLQKSDKMNEASIDDNASILEGLVNFLNDNNITADNIDKNKDLVEKYLSDNKLGISAYIPTIYKVAKDDYGIIGRIIFYRSKNEWGFNTSSIVIESNKINESFDLDLIEKNIKGKRLSNAARYLGALVNGDRNSFEIQGSELVSKLDSKDKVMCDVEGNDIIKSIVKDFTHLTDKTESKQVESRDRVAENLSKFIYDLTTDKDTEAYGETAWSGNQPTKMGNGITVYEVYKNGKSNYTMDDIKKAVLEKFPELDVYGTAYNSILFYKPQKTENKLQEDTVKFTLNTNLNESNIDKYNTIPEIKDRLREINKQLAYIRRRDSVSLSIGTEQEQEELRSEKAKLSGRLRKLRNNAVDMDKMTPEQQKEFKQRLKDLQLLDDDESNLQSAIQSYRNHYIQEFESYTKKEENNTNLEYNYMLLDRLRSDCEYFLGNGNRNEKHLWAGSVDAQINEMKKIWNSLKEKPEWLTMEDINNYEKLMKDKKAIRQSKNLIKKYNKELNTNLDEAKENDLSKDLYQDEANKRITKMLMYLDIYLEAYDKALEENDSYNISLNETKINSKIEYLIPALNIKGGIKGLIKYLEENDFTFENRFKEFAHLLQNFDKEIKTEALNYENLVVLNNLGDTQFVKARKDKEDKEFKKSGAVMISKDDPNSLKNAHDLAIRAQSCIYKLEDIQSELNKLAPTTNYDVEKINRILADYGFDAYVTDLYRKNLGNLDDVNSCQNFVSILINQLQQIKEKDLNESKIIENNKEKDPINVFSKDSEEYKRLQKVCDLLNERTNENVKFTIEETHFDYGQNWKWTTIITKDLIDGNSWQTLNPRQQEEIINGKNPDDIINTILSGMLYKNFKLDKINEGLDDWDLKAKDLEKKFKDAYEEYKKNNKYPLSYLDWNNLLTTKDKEKIIAGNKKTESKVDNLVLNQFRNIIDLADKGYKVDLIAADGTKVSFDEEDLKAMYTGLVGNDNDLIKLPSEENPEETRNFIQSQLDKSYNKKYESRPDKDAVTEARQVKIQEDQYENERRKGRPNINKIAKAEFYDNQDWYIQHIKDYKDEKDFIEKEKAEIAFEYNLTEIRSELVCKQIYQLAKENDLI